MKALSAILLVTGILLLCFGTACGALGAITLFFMVEKIDQKFRKQNPYKMNHHIKSVDDIILIGKHSGKSVKWIIENDIYYAKYMTSWRDHKFDSKVINEIYNFEYLAK